MVDKLSDSQVQEYKRVFDVHKNETGNVEYRYLDKILNELRLQADEDEMESIYEHLDIYCNGSVSFPHFLSLMANKFDQPAIESRARVKQEIVDDLLEEMKEAFKVFDSDGNGFISQAELKHTLMNMGQAITDEEIEEMMMEADTDGDGQISFSEFCRLMKIQELEDNPNTKSCLTNIQEV